MTRGSLKDIAQPVVKDLAAFDRKLEKILDADSLLIKTLVKHIMAARGKRIRPVILFLAARGAGYGNGKLVDAALAIELIHTATLLHDDVVDEADTRRGQATVNAQWNNLVSVLMGDFLFSRAFHIMVKTGSAELIKSVSNATERVSFGELRQIEEAANYELTQDEYIRIIADKTASLFATACEVGPIMNGVDGNLRKRLYRFGENIGIAFQIADDLLDFIGDKQKTGKPLGSDLVQGKVTLPLIYSLRHSSPNVRNEMTHILNNGTREKDADRVVRFITEQGGIDYAYKVARQYSDQAAGIFDNLKNNQYSRTLRKLIDFTVSRDN